MFISAKTQWIFILKKTQFCLNYLDSHLTFNVGQVVSDKYFHVMSILCKKTMSITLRRICCEHSSSLSWDLLVIKMLSQKLKLPSWVGPALPHQSLMMLQFWKISLWLNYQSRSFLLRMLNVEIDFGLDLELGNKQRNSIDRKFYINHAWHVMVGLF